MSKTKGLGSKNFWMTLAIMLGVTVVISAIALLCLKPFGSTAKVSENKTVISSSQQVVNEDHSFEATKERVDSANENLGREVKSAYSGENSTFERMMKQRMILSTIKHIIIYALLILVILLILVKGFNLVLFKRKKTEEVSDGDNTVAEEPVNETPIEGKPSDMPKKECVPEKEEEKEYPKSTLPESQTKPAEADEAEVIEGCKLP